MFQAEKRWVGGAFVRNHSGLLRGKRVVILGAGAIALAIRQQFSSFECLMQLLARTNPAAELHSVDDLKAVLPETDIVINTLPESTGGFFSADLIGPLRFGSMYASVSRGNTTDEVTLPTALQGGRLSGAVLNVTVN